MGGLTKTNAARLLDRAKIPYELIPYEVDENNLAAGHVAESLGEDIRGGCSPIGMKKSFPTFYHTTAPAFGHIFISAGIRGLQLKIDPAQLIAYTNGQVADLTVS